MSARLAFNLFLLAIAAYFVWSATGYDAPAARIPLLIGGLVLVAQAWVTVGDFRAAARGMPEAACAGEDGEAPPPDEGRRVAAVSAWMLFYLVLFAVVGTLPAIFLFVFLFLLAAKDVRWWKGGAIAAVITVAIRLLFVDLMHFELYAGLLFGATLPPL